MRRIYSLIIIATFIAVQLSSIPVAIVLTVLNPNLNEQELLKSTLPYLAVAFLIGVIICISIGHIHKNKNRIERGRQTGWPVTIAVIIGGIFFAYIAQLIASLINIYVLGNPIESANTQQIIGMIEEAPLMIAVVAILGPIIEEYVFRRAIFAEIYEMIPNKIFGFIVAFIISGFIFGLAHMDFSHMLLYLAMSFVFSLLYVLTGRLLVPIVVHALMNTVVVILQLLFKDQIENFDMESFGYIYHVFIHIIF